MIVLFFGVYFGLFCVLFGFLESFDLSWRNLDKNLNDFLDVKRNVIGINIIIE